MTTYQYEQPQFRFSAGRITYGVQVLILANVLVFVLQLLVDIPLDTGAIQGAPGGEFLDWTQFSVLSILQDYRVWGVFTYMFIHSGVSHLFWNMLMLFFFGPDVERILGTRQFFRFYFLCGMLGVLANFIPVFLFNAPAIPVIGASGAALGILVAFAIVEPERQIFLFPFPFPIYARGLVIIVIVMNLVSGISGGTGTSVATHFGGMAVGYLYMKARPTLSSWQLGRRIKRQQKKTKDDDDTLAEAINNIFKFEDKNKK